MIDAHLPVLQIVIPLLTSPLCILVRANRRVMALVIATCWLVFAMSCRLLYLVSQQGAITYQLGGWPAPWGIEYRVDGLSALILLIVSGMGAIVITYAPTSVDREIPVEQQTLFYTLYLLSLTGLLGIVITGDLFNLFVFLEISSLSTYALISLGKHRRALVAAFQYLVMGTIGATFILIGIGLTYQITGGLNMADLASLLTRYTGDHASNRTVLVAFAFLSVGISLKMAVFPLHQWLPNAYTFAPSVVTAFLAATATKVSVYVLLRVTYTIFKPHFAFELMPLDVELMGLALIGILWSSTAAIFQQNLKRLLAFSSIAQIGYIVLGLSLASVGGVTASVLHIFNHALIKGGLFMATGCLALRLPSLDLKHLHGIGRRMPWTATAWAIGGLGLIGVPLTSGFVSKWYLIVSLLGTGTETNEWRLDHLAAVLVIGASLLAAIYVWRFVDVAFFREPTAEVEAATEAPLRMLLPTYFVIGLTLVFGVWPTLPTQLAAQAASAVIGSTH
ncbi:MAG: monovalent cation/H+ antiporter subunit D family protein [Planctomycetales bacterium]|nr:monovalent cation/H+ antiporter subunit D family protein [Planctomycetales bacterium]